MRYRSALIIVIGVVASAAFVPSSSAMDKGSIGTITPKKQHLEFEGTPLIGFYPYSNSPRQAFANYRPTACRTVTYCDTVAFEVHYPNPERFLRENLFALTISLSWDNPYHEKTNPNGNDLDLFLWGDDDPASGGPASKCGSPATDACDNIMPETVTLTEPPDTTAEDAEPAAILLTIVNERGVNTGYKINVDWYYFDIAASPAFKPPERHRSFKDTVQGPYDFEVTEATKGTQTPAPTPRKILVPGPDGKLHEVELPIYAAGQRLGMSAQRNSAVPWITASIVGALALAGLIFYLIRRNRQAMNQL